MDIIDTILEENIVASLIDAYNISPLYKDDLAQEIWLILLGYDKDKLKELHTKNQLRFFIAKIITNQYFSKTSTFYKKYKKFNNMIDESTNPFQEQPTEDDE